MSLLAEGVLVTVHESWGVVFRWEGFLFGVAEVDVFSRCGLFDQFDFREPGELHVSCAQHRGDWETG